MPAPLNPAQREAVETLSGPLLVLAGAGTGKTRVVTYRIGNLIHHGTRPDRILAVTFTNKAAAEMQQRIGELIGRRAKPKPEISTFHSLCVRVLRRHIERLGYPKKFAIYDRSDQESVARKVLREIRAPSESLRPSDLLYEISKWKTLAVGPEEALETADTDKQHLAATAYRRYQRQFKSLGAVDFDDLLLLVDRLFRKYRDVSRSEAARFDHVLIDEYQDTNGMQYRIVRALAAGHRNLCVVGDDDQSIYGWRGAEVEHILSFKRDWPEAKLVRLQQNYRSTHEILTLANRLIAFNRSRYEKELAAVHPGGEKPTILQCRDEEDEARQIVAGIQRRLAQPEAEPRDIAILLRTNEQSRPLEMQLRRGGVPYVVIGGMSFYDRREVRDVLALLRLIANPEDEPSLLRIINTPPRGLGNRSVRTLMQQATEAGVPLWHRLKQASRSDGVTAAAVQGARELCDIVERHRKIAKTRSLVDTATSMLREVRYRQELERLYEDPNDRDARLATIESVINALGRYEERNKKPTMNDFLDELALAERDDQSDGSSKLDSNAVKLLTIHSAKGLEFPDVYLAGVEEGILPHRKSVESGDQSIEEERRLCYVAVTRAQQRLTLSLALSRLKWGKSRPTQPSRFLYELTGTADRFDNKKPSPKGKARPKATRKKKRSRG